MAGFQVITEANTLAIDNQTRSTICRDLAKATARPRTTFAMYFKKVAEVGPLTIDQNHVHWLTGECFRDAQSGKSTANDHDLFPQSMLQSILSWHFPRPGSCGSAACRDDSTRLCQMPRCFVLISICLVSQGGTPYPRRTFSPSPKLDPQKCRCSRFSHHPPKLCIYALHPRAA